MSTRRRAPINPPCLGIHLYLPSSYYLPTTELPTVFPSKSQSRAEPYKYHRAAYPIGTPFYLSIY
jgi:hypothetical protein